MKFYAEYLRNGWRFFSEFRIGPLHPEANNEGLSLVTETGDVWQSDDRTTVRKLNTAVAAKYSGFQMSVQVEIAWNAHEY